MATTYTLISSNTLSSSAASVTFSSIPSTYTDLVVRASTRDVTTGNGILKFIFNSDSAANYSYIQVRGDGATAGTTNGSASTYIYGGILNGNSLTANTFSPFEIYIPSYLSSQKKQIGIDTVQESNATTPIYRGAAAGLWQGTAAITSITFLPNGANFLAGSSFYLYGIKNS